MTFYQPAPDRSISRPAARRRALLIAAAFASTGGFAQASQSLPSVVTDDLADARTLTRRSEATLRFFGIKVYDIRLWTPNRPYQPDQLFALELTYDLSFKGADIARRSVEEMRKVGYSDDTKLARWTDTMLRIFPDVAKGEALIGVSVPGKEVRFYSRTRSVARVPDPEFARAFFDIWLSERTSEPRLRERLLAAS
jgi:hypothetical protein